MDDDARIDDDALPADPPEHDALRARDARWVRDALDGDQAAFGRLYDAWFDRVFHLVQRIVRDVESAREVSQDAFLSAWRGLSGLQDPHAFGGWLLRIARNAALNRSDREARSRPVDDQGLAVIEGTRASPVSAPTGFGVEERLARADDPDLAAADGEIAGLVRETVAALGDRDAEVLDLQLRFDLSPAEVGEVIGLNRNAANQLCHRVRARFAAAFGARMLWSGARTACPELAQALGSAGVTSFGPEAVTLIDRHASGCADCEERRATRLQPSALFAAMPLLAAPEPMRGQIAAQLTAHGVPMEGSTASAAAEPASSGWPDGDAGARALPSATPDPATGEPRPGAAAARATSQRILSGTIAALVVVVVGLTALLLTRGGPDDPELAAVDAGAAPSTTSPDPGDGGTSARTGSGTGGAEPGTADPASPTTSASTTSTTAPAPPAIEQFVLDPDDDQPTAYPLGPTSPTLRWSTAEAAAVQVWMWFTDANGPHPRQLLSTDPSGVLQVCPGTQPAPGTCETAPGTYSFVIEVTGSDGTTIASTEETPPSFDVYAVLL